MRAAADGHLKLGMAATVALAKPGPSFFPAAGDKAGWRRGVFDDRDRAVLECSETRARPWSRPPLRWTLERLACG